MSADIQQFSGTDQYIATDSLKLAVKAARSLQNPFWLKVSRVQVKPCWLNRWHKALD